MSPENRHHHTVRCMTITISFPLLFLLFDISLGHIYTYIYIDRLVIAFTQ